jgi:ligand-binding SRPBCC domain-containing protein
MPVTLFQGLLSPDQVASPYRLEREQVIPISRDRVFDFFAEAGNLESITPPWLNFQIRTPRPIDMRQGALIDYTIRWGVIPLAWRTEIREWHPPHRFIDVQLVGPYRLWHHLHEFETCIVDGREMTRMRDVVQYALPATGLSWMVHRVLVKRDLERIFDYRYAKIEELFGASYNGLRARSEENVQKARTSVPSPT